MRWRTRASRTRARAAAEHHHDQVAFVAVQVDRDVEAGGADEAGLDSVDAGDAAEQMVVVAHAVAVPHEMADREEVEVLRETILQRAGEDGLVARGGELAVVRQARGVVVIRVHHAKGFGLGGHHPARI